jgi:eukaryotic-like serine/threonine-protein kinase
VAAILLGLRIPQERGATPSSPDAATAAPTTQPTGAPTNQPSADGSPAGPNTGNANGSAPAAGATGALPAPPSGWQTYRDPTGFQLYVPAGWERSQQETIVYFRDPATGRVLGIDQTNQPKPDPVADWATQAAYRVARGDFPRYEQIKIAAVPYFLKAADWEFTYDGRGGRVHVLNRGFVASAHKAYGIWWQTPDAQWTANLTTIGVVFDSFRPAG